MVGSTQSAAFPYVRALVAAITGTPMLMIPTQRAAQYPNFARTYCPMVVGTISASWMS